MDTIHCRITYTAVQRLIPLDRLVLAIHDWAERTGGILPDDRTLAQRCGLGHPLFITATRQHLVARAELVDDDERGVPILSDSGRQALRQGYRQVHDNDQQECEVELASGDFPGYREDGIAMPEKRIRELLWAKGKNEPCQIINGRLFVIDSDLIGIPA